MLIVVILAAIFAFVKPNSTVDDFYQLTALDIHGKQVSKDELKYDQMFLIGACRLTFLSSKAKPC